MVILYIKFYYDNTFINHSLFLYHKLLYRLSILSHGNVVAVRLMDKLECVVVCAVLALVESFPPHTVYSTSCSLWNWPNGSCCSWLITGIRPTFVGLVSCLSGTVSIRIRFGIGLNRTWKMMKRLIQKQVGDKGCYCCFVFILLSCLIFHVVHFDSICIDHSCYLS